jgi:hypothetical protein
LAEIHLRQGNEGDGMADPDDKGKAPVEDPEASGELIMMDGTC